jgi:peptidoglycan biosynthesis protein MviN/MurJ (putative lipid II flippase)
MADPVQEQQIASRATLVALGSVLSRIMGLIREVAIANIYGASGAVSAFQAASQVPLNLYELLVGGMVSSALVPTLSEYAAPERRAQLGRLASLLFTLAILVLGLLVIVFEMFTPLISSVLVKFPAPLQTETTRLLRTMLVSILFLGLSGLATAVCHSLQRFALPAFTAVVFNASIVVSALVLGPRWIRELEHPTVDDIWVDDLVTATLVSQPDGTLIARSLAVVPPGSPSDQVLGRVSSVTEGTVHLAQLEEDPYGDKSGNEIQFEVNDRTHISVQRRQVSALAIGLVVGAALQVVLQLPALYDVPLRPVLDVRHPALRQILRLYLPVVLSLAVASIGIVIDRNLASRTGNQSISWMAVATRLIQFPLGLISMAIATAILPTLARMAVLEQRGHKEALEEKTGQEAYRRVPDSHEFCATLASGLRLVLVLCIPATIGLLVLARPLVALLFQHGEFSSLDTEQTSLALRFYLIGLLPAALDQPLVFAFYARKDTWRPALVGILGVVFYLAVALPTYRGLGMVGLILANGAQLTGHAVVMLVLFERRVGTLRGHAIGRTTLRSLVAAAAMGGAIYGTVQGVQRLWPIAGRTGWALTVLVGGGIGLGVYLALCTLLDVGEIRMVFALARQTLQRVASSSSRQT